MATQDEMDFVEAINLIRESDDYSLLINYLMTMRPLSDANKVDVGSVLKRLVESL
jgi:hypothetical protein